MSQNTLTRENLHPIWSDLSERTERSRADFRQGGSEDAFKAALRGLGFEEMALLIEVECNRPMPAEVIEARVRRLVSRVNGIPKEALFIEVRNSLIVWEPFGEVRTVS